MLFGAAKPVKKHGPGMKTSLIVATPIKAIPFRKVAILFIPPPNP